MPPETPVDLKSLWAAASQDLGPRDLSGHLPEFDQEVYNLIRNGLGDSLSGNSQSGDAESDPDNFYLAHDRREFIYLLYFLGLITLLQNRITAIATDLLFTLGLNPKSIAIEAGSQRQRIEMFNEKDTNEHQAEFATKFLKALISGNQKENNDLTERVHALKCLRDLIVHPKLPSYKVDEGGKIDTILHSQHRIVSKQFPGVIDDSGRFHISQRLIENSIEDARSIVRNITECCELDYLYLFRDDYFSRL